jgi:hypothetical protein
MTANFAAHPYSTAVFGGAFNGYGGIPFYQTLVLGGTAALLLQSLWVPILICQ